MSTALLGTGDASAASASQVASCDVTLAWLGDDERLRLLMALGVALRDLGDLDKDDFEGVAVAAGELRTSAIRHETKSVVERTAESLRAGLTAVWLLAWEPLGGAG